MQISNVQDGDHGNTEQLDQGVEDPAWLHYGPAPRPGQEPMQTNTMSLHYGFSGILAMRWSQLHIRVTTACLSLPVVLGAAFRFYRGTAKHEEHIEPRCGAIIARCVAAVTSDLPLVSVCRWLAGNRRIADQHRPPIERSFRPSSGCILLFADCLMVSFQHSA